MIHRLVKRLRRQDGFTLIELIVVVAILGILAAVLTPRVLDAIDNAKKSGAEATAKQVQLALEREYLKNGYPTLNDLTAKVTESGTAGLTVQDLAKLIEDYATMNPSDYGAFTYQGYKSSDLADANKEAAGVKPKFYVITLVHTASGKTLTITPNSVTLTP